MFPYFKIEGSRDSSQDVFIIIKKDKTVYSYGSNKDLCGVSSDESNFGEFDDSELVKPKIMKKLCGKNIKTFILSLTDGLLAITNEGEVYIEKLYILQHF